MRTNRPRMETRDIAAVLIGLEAGLGIGLLAFGTTLLAPMGDGPPRRRRRLRHSDAAGWSSSGARCARSCARPADTFRLMSDLKDALDRARGGGPERHHEKSSDQGKLPVRERVARLVDADSFVEDALLANWEQEGFGADGVVTGMATIGGRPVALMANDPTVKAGSWGPKTVEKIIRIQEQALEHLVPMVYLVDSAGARITDQVQMFPGRRGAGRIFHTEVKLSGVVPQVCVLFGPSAAGGAYIPAFCDVVIMRDGNASMYLGSPRMAEMVIGEKVTLEEMGGARMHTGVSGCGHFLVKSDEEGIDLAKAYLGYFGSNWREQPPVAPPAEPAARVPGDPGRREQAVRHARADRRARGRRLVPRGAEALGEGADRGLRAARGPRRSGSSPTSRSSGAACCSWTPRTRPRASSGPATPSTCRCSSSPTCRAS